ncbi:DUF5819 family protein [Streptomyces sp. RB6PN25]|uniref:DUF5819 family protein n=1 Tax=Streptomyces humicola TaxID=2953240 RepID=A0ABT1PZX7_9ACTN|nr:DUF5819 family protein [Streptomyces humicola]MCQ4083217.1 DUF5819 family protein [Streptomyces humicola]
MEPPETRAADEADEADEAGEAVEVGERVPVDGPPGEPELPDSQEISDLQLTSVSLTSRIVIALTVAAVIVGAAFHLGMVFLSIAPSNTLSQQYSTTINDYVYPEFEQNWKLFAPNPLQENDDVQARAEVLMPDGTSTTTGWVDLTALDQAQIVHNPFPSHTQQNELRRAWSFYTDSHDSQGHPVGLRGTLAQEYVLRIVAHRFGPHLNGGTVQRIQVRSADTPVGSPPWSGDSNGTSTATSYQPQPWWNVSSEDFT